MHVPFHACACPEKGCPPSSDAAGRFVGSCNYMRNHMGRTVQPGVASCEAQQQIGCRSRCAGQGRVAVQLVHVASYMSVQCAGGSGCAFARPDCAIKGRLCVSGWPKPREAVGPGLRKPTHGLNPCAAAAPACSEGGGEAACCYQALLYCGITLQCMRGSPSCPLAPVTAQHQHQQLQQQPARSTATHLSSSSCVGAGSVGAASTAAARRWLPPRCGCKPA